MIREYKDAHEADEVSREAHWLAYLASGAVGMGWLQERGGESRDVVVAAHDSGVSHYADYVFGRMVKLYIQRTAPNTLMLSDDTPRRDYQSWAGKYPSYAALIESAEKSVAAQPAQEPA